MINRVSYIGINHVAIGATAASIDATAAIDATTASIDAIDATATIDAIAANYATVAIDTTSLTDLPPLMELAIITSQFGGDVHYGSASTR